MTGVVARVWRESFGEWWAELWTPHEDHDPPSPFVDFTRNEEPDPVPNCRRRGLKLCLTRRSAIRAATRMRARYEQGLDPEHDKPVAEVLS